MAPKRMCYNCRETFNGFEDDRCESCGSYDTGPVYEAERFPDDRPYDLDDTEDGFYEGDFDDWNW